MKNAIAIFAALCAGSAIVGCNSDKPAPASVPALRPNPPESTHHAPAWTLTLKSDCGGDASENCVGGYGFSIFSDGKYQAGPGPNGELLNGKISQEDLASINAAMTSLLAGPRLLTEGHQSVDSSASNDTVTFIQSAESSDAQTIIKTEGTDMTYQTQSFDEAKQLLASLHDLATKYYTLPFPDACGVSANALANLLSTMQTCTANSDCAYFDSSLDVVAANSNQYLTTDDCTVIHPLVVGNSNAVKTNKTKIEEAMEGVRNTCGNSLMRSDCAGVTGFQLTGAAAVCSQGVCKAPN